jgi:hypothetical protein
MSVCRVKIQCVNDIGHNDKIRDVYCARHSVSRNSFATQQTKQYVNTYTVIVSI